MARQSPRAILHNWRTYDGSFPTKVRLAARNLGRRAELRSNCCGRPGEPGC